MFHSFVAEPRSKTNIEFITQKYLKRTFPDHLVKLTRLNVERLLDVKLYQTHNFGIEIVESLGEGVEALTEPFDGKIKFSKEGWNKLIQKRPRSLFTGCHEAYHVIDHSEQLLRTDLEVVLKRIILYRGNIPTYQDPEWQALHGAGALLMPLPTFIPFVNKLQKRGAKFFDILREITRYYGVSQQAAETRLAKIGMKKNP